MDRTGGERVDCKEGEERVRMGNSYDSELVVFSSPWD